MISLHNKFLYTRYEYKVMTVWTLLNMGNLSRPNAAMYSLRNELQDTCYSSKNSSIKATE